MIIYCFLHCCFGIHDLCNILHLNVRCNYAHEQEIRYINKQLNEEILEVKGRSKDKIYGKKKDDERNVAVTLKLMPFLGGGSIDKAPQASRYCLSRNVGDKSLF